MNAQRIADERLRTWSRGHWEVSSPRPEDIVHLADEALEYRRSREAVTAVTNHILEDNTRLTVLLVAADRVVAAAERLADRLHLFDEHYLLEALMNYRKVKREGYVDAR